MLNSQNKLTSNIWKYNLYKVFTKRVYLPLITIYLTSQAGVSLAQIGLIVSVSSLAQLLLEIPTGYLADRWGHKRTVLLGGFLITCSVLAYLGLPNIWGALLAGVLFFGGGSFASGAMQTFMYDTLRALGKAHEYARVMGRGQSYGLLGNVVLIALVPLTYSINPQLPFLIGFICHLAGFMLAWSLVVPMKEVSQSESKNKPSLRSIAKQLPLVDLLVLFMLVGVVSGLTHAAPEFRELVLQSLGVPVIWFGAILALGSLLAAAAGRIIHRLEFLSPKWFYLCDAVFVCSLVLVIGATHSTAVVVAAFLLITMYDRNRSIVVEAHLFRNYPLLPYRATLLSFMNSISQLNSIWIPLMLAYSFSRFGLQPGFWVSGLAVSGLLLALYVVYFVRLQNHKMLGATSAVA